MLVYSKKIMQFINHVKTIAKDVLSREVGLKVFGERFYDRRQEYSYPIKIVIFNNQKMLGYFDASFYEIGFNECLMHIDANRLKNIIRHELAHYITFINYGDVEKPHGDEFKAFCQRMQWSEDVQKATTCLDDGVNPPSSEESSVLRKVQKLMALSTSSNQNEAEQAMIKSQQLLLKHNIEFTSFADDEKVILKRILKQKKDNAKMRATAQILETFFVNTVYNRKDGFTYLEIVGSAINVEIAEYVANVLQHKLETLWSLTQKQHQHLKGKIAKNSFLMGVAYGYCNKIQFLKQQYDKNTSNALIVIERQLEEASKMIYPRLTQGKSHGQYCSQSSFLGEQAGKQLNINPGINNKSTTLEPSYLSFIPS